MKKILYIILLTMSSVVTITSCTEEDVKPSVTDNGGGGEIIKGKD
jgi:hypothetical protein